MRSNITRIRLHFDPIYNRASVEGVWRSGNGTVCQITPIPVFRMMDVMESLKDKGFDQPVVEYVSTVYGVTLTYKIRE